MPRQNVSLVAFNRGLISKLALARTDIERAQFSAETMTNWTPRVLGSMMLRMGTQYLGSTYSDSAARFIPFVFSTDDVALIEVTDSLARIWINDAVMTRSSVSSAVTNGAFTSNVTGWTDSDEAGASSVWVTGGYLGLTGTGTLAAIRDQQVTVAAGDQGTEHALRVVINRGPVRFRVGSSAGEDDYIAETDLDEGTHSLSFTPTGDFHIRFSNALKRQVLVDSCTVESSGAVTITAPWAEADLDKITYDQSGDIIFVACAGYQQYKIERRSTTSWSIVKYFADDGPFRVENTSATTITPSATSGSVTLTASKGIFQSGHVGALFRITSTGQTVTASVDTGGTWTDPIEVEGVDSQRVFTIIRSGIWSGTVTLQRSLTASTGPWEDVTTYTTNATITYDDGLDNQIAWYRIGVDTSDFSSGSITGATQANPCVITVVGHPFSTGEVVGITGVGGMTELNGNSYTITKLTADTFSLNGIDSTGYGAYTAGGTATSEGPVSLTLDYAIGSVDGITRITAVASETSATADVLVTLGNTDATAAWGEGEWSTYRGFPSSVAFADGRLAWSGKNGIWMSVSDGFYSFDDNVTGDSAPISKVIGAGPVDTINWILPLQRLLLGAEGSELVCKASSFDEPLTATDFSIRTASTQGSAPVNPVKLDKIGIYVQRGGVRVMELSLQEDGEYGSTELTLLCPEATESTIKRMAIQRQPDARVHCVRTDGKVAVMTIDRAESVRCWYLYETDGTVEDVVVLPGVSGDAEDYVYYVVNRTINGATKRYLELFAFESEGVGGTLNKQLDCFAVYSGASTTGLSGLSHLEGETVYVWGGGKDLGSYTVSSGAITLSEAVTDAVVGLTYTAQWKSAKMAYASGLGTALTQKKKINQLGVILLNTHHEGLKYGPDFTNLDSMPQIHDGAIVADDTIYTSADEEMVNFPGQWNTDSRLCLQAQAPKPCTILAAVLGIETHDKS